MADETVLHENSEAVWVRSQNLHSKEQQLQTLPKAIRFDKLTAACEVSCSRQRPRTLCVMVQLMHLFVIKH
jgi:hypothetical protein